MATKNSMVVKQAELIPKIEESAVAQAFSQLQDEMACIPAFKARAEALTVTNADEYKEAGEFRAVVRSRRKMPKFITGPFEEIAKRVIEILKDKRTEAENKFDAIDAAITTKMNQQAERERMAAEAEQRRINEEKRLREEKEAAERRKAELARIAEEKKAMDKEIADAQKAGELKKREAEKLRKEAEERAKRDREAAAQEEATAKENFRPVEVKPNLPTIAGSRRHRSFFAEFTNFNVLLESWRTAANNGSLERAAFLRRFICGNEKELAKEARDTRDSKVMETVIPGIKARDKDIT